MSDLQDMLRVQARLHRKQGANALGQPFESAIEEIQLLNKTYNQLFDAFQDCQGELAKANERVSELEKQFETQMTNDFVTTTDQAKRITELEKYNLDLANESHKYQERCAELEKELANKDLLHVGFTNGAQIKYAKDEEGAFYPDTDGDCYIPLYMLKSHEHRIETTSIEQLRKEQDNE